MERPAVAGRSRVVFNEAAHSKRVADAVNRIQRVAVGHSGGILDPRIGTSIRMPTRWLPMEMRSI